MGSECPCLKLEGRILCQCLQHDSALYLQFTEAGVQ